MKAPRVSLDQWRALQAVVDYGGFSQAAEQLNRSQSSVSYAVSKLQDQLGLKLLYIDGRKARLSEAGKILLQRSRQLLKDAQELEALAKHLEQGWEPEIKLYVEQVYPTNLLMTVLERFAPICQDTRVKLHEVILSGAEQALLSGDADLVISPYIPQGFLGDALIDVEFIAVAHPEHPLHQLNRDLNQHDISREIHVVISDSGFKSMDAGWLGDSHRWTVTSVDSAVEVISHGLGFGWLPLHRIEQKLNTGELKVLPLQEGRQHCGTMNLIFGKPDFTGPATKQLAELFKQVSEK